MGDEYTGINSNRIGHYKGRLPSPPRMMMEGWPGAIPSDLSLSQLPQHLDAVNIREFFVPTSTETEPQLEWKYNQRREFQLVLPFLCLGPFSAIKEPAQLQARNITMLIALVHISNPAAHKYVPAAARNAFQLEIPTRVFHTSNNQELIKIFPDAIELIDEHVRNNPKAMVAIACETGNDRSACVAVAYLISILDLEAARAIQIVTARRFCCAIDDDRKTIIEAWADLQRARRDAGLPRSMHDPNLQVPNASLNARKRSRERLAEEDDDEMDLDGMSQPREFTPFYD